MALFILTKICTKCSCELPTLDFHKQKTGRYGFKSVCKICTDLICLKWKKAKPEQRKATLAKYYQANKEKQKVASQKWQKANPEKVKAIGKEWNLANPDKVRSGAERWRHNHPGEMVEIRKKWKLANPEKYKANSAKANYKRRRLLANTRCDLTLAQWQEIKAFYKYRCAFCNKKTKLTQDHFVPVSKGGEHTASNIIPLCLSCNCTKGNREIKETFQPHLFMG